MPNVDAYMAFREAAESAIERAHEAAAGSRGAALRRGLEAPLQAIPDAMPLSPDTATTARLQRVDGTLRRALSDLDKCRLAELGALLQSARRDIGSYDVAG